MTLCLQVTNATTEVPQAVHQVGPQVQDVQAGDESILPQETTDQPTSLESLGKILMSHKKVMNPGCCNSFDNAVFLG